MGLHWACSERLYCNFGDDRSRVLRKLKGCCLQSIHCGSGYGDGEFVLQEFPINLSE